MKIFNFMLGLSQQVTEEASKFKASLENEYGKILTIGTNNNSDSAVAFRQTTELVIIFIEELKLKFKQE